MAHMEGSINLEAMFLKNGYRLGERLGKGSFAVVKKAVHLPTGRELAVKIVDHNLATKEFLEKFLSRELNIIGGLKHQHIIDVEKIVRIGAYTCVIMEQAKRGDLLEYILSRNSLPEDETRGIFQDVVVGVQYLHGNNIAHRDLKCENILLDEHGRAKLSDFGFARYVTDPTTNRRVLSSTYCGSAAYVAPEVLRGTPYNPMLSDAWSLGVVLFIAVTGLMPFDDSDLPRMLHVQIKKRWGFPSSKKDQLSSMLQQLVRRMLEPDSMARITLSQILTSEWVTSGPPPPKTANQPTQPSQPFSRLGP